MCFLEFPISGGYFDYKQYQIEELARSVDKLIRRKMLESCAKDDAEQGYSNYSPETLQEFKAAARLLRQAAIYVQRIDWLVSGDDSENGFHARLKKELAEVETNLASEAVAAGNEQRLFAFLYQSYKQGTGTTPGCERENRKVLRSYESFLLPDGFIAEIKAFLEANPWVFEEVRAYAVEYQTEIKKYGYSRDDTFSYFFNQPVVLLMYYLAAKMPDKVYDYWPLDSDRVLKAILVGLNNKKAPQPAKKSCNRKSKP